MRLVHSTNVRVVAIVVDEREKKGNRCMRDADTSQGPLNERLSIDCEHRVTYEIL